MQSASNKQYLTAIHKTELDGQVKIICLKRVADNVAIAISEKNAILLKWDKNAQQLTTQHLFDVNTLTTQIPAPSDSICLYLTDIILTEEKDKFVLFGISYSQTTKKWSTCIFSGDLSDDFSKATLTSGDYSGIETQFKTDLIENNKILLGAKNGNLYLLSLNQQGFDLTSINTPHREEVNSIKLLAVDNDRLEYLTISTGEHCVKKWTLNKNLLQATLDWPSLIPTDLYMPHDYNICVLADFILVQSRLKNNYVVYLLDKNNGKRIKEFNLHSNYIAPYPFDHNVAVVYSNNTLTLVQFTTETMTVIDSLTPDHNLQGPGMYYPQSVTSCEFVGKNEFLLSNGADLAKYDLNKKQVEYFSNFSFKPEHFGAEAWVLLNDTDMLVTQNQDNPTAAIKTYAEKKPELLKKEEKGEENNFSATLRRPRSRKKPKKKSSSEASSTNHVGWIIGLCLGAATAGALVYFAGLVALGTLAGIGIVSGIAALGALCGHWIANGHSESQKKPKSTIIIEDEANDLQQSSNKVIHSNLPKVTLSEGLSAQAASSAQTRSSLPNRYQISFVHGHDVSAAQDESVFTLDNSTAKPF